MLNMADERKADSLLPFNWPRRTSSLSHPGVTHKETSFPLQPELSCYIRPLKLIKCVRKKKTKKKHGWVLGRVVRAAPANQLICVTVTFSDQNLAEVDAERVRQMKRPVGGSVSGTWRCPGAASLFFFSSLFLSPFNSTNCKWLLFHLDFIRKHIKPIKI